MTTAKYGALFPHVAPRTRELLHILVHGAANLPMIDGRPPECYVTVQSQATMKTQEVGGRVNATNIVEGVSPQWNEMIYAEISEDSTNSEEVILIIIDEQSQATLVQHRFPWRWLEPFYQYHLNLQQESRQTGSTTCLYISIMNKRSSLSKEKIQYFGLEALLNGFDVPLTNSQSIYAVARIVPDYKSYKYNYLTNPDQHELGINFRKVVFPNHQDFFLHEFSSFGYPHLSIASKQSKLPIWKYDFFFSHANEKDHMFTTRTSALVIEFYPYHPIANDTNWHISGLLGWIVILLDSRSFDALTSAAATEGLRTEGLVVESEGDLMADNSKYLTAEIFLRLVKERHPMRNLLLLSEKDLPILPSYNDRNNRQNNTDPVYLQAAVSNKSFLPAIKASTPATPPRIHSPAPTVSV